MTKDITQYEESLKRLTWLELEDALDKLYTKYNVFKERNDTANLERVEKAIEYAEAEKELRIQ